MFPVVFDHTLLDGLPLPDEEDVKRVVQILKAIILRRIVPYFKKRKGTDPIAAARVTDNLSIQRMEDSENRVPVASLFIRDEQAMIIQVHERVFDYFAFVIPSHPESRLGEGTPEERKVLAFAELVMRHQLEHLLYPAHTEKEVMQSDVVFAMDRRSDDPTYYRALRNVLSDEMNGLQGRPYLAMFDLAEQGLSYDPQLSEMLNNYAAVLGDLPGRTLQKVFASSDVELKTKILGACYRKSRDTSFSLLRRTSFIQKTLRLFVHLMESDKDQAEQVFEAFKASWGLLNFLQELGIRESTVEGKNTSEIFRLFKNSMRQFIEEADGFFYPVPPPAAAPRPEPKPVPVPVKSLKDRIDDAHSDPSFPSQVLEVIDKNKLNAVGHSGSKYSELIETLLAMPWGKIQKIQVSPEEFEMGLNLSHFGLQKPKDTICDFFTNLIWRYQEFSEENQSTWKRNGSAFLFVGPPGVGKTSLAISIAKNLEIPYHKVSLAGTRDEADLKGHSFTYEGSKPGAIVQGLIKMGIMNGMFIMDEADKTEKFAVATLLEILDPEQNHLFHDKYTATTVDIDLSNCHFMLTANTLETVPPAVINRCEIIFLDRYSIEEKVAIARQYLVERVRKQYQISAEQIFFDPGEETDLLRYLIKTYTREAGVRELERIIRTMVLRIFRKEILVGDQRSVCITREKIKQYLVPPLGPRNINEDDRVGEMMGLGVNVELGIGSVIPVQATPIEMGGKGDDRPGYLSMIHATGNIQKIMDESRKVATTAIFHCARGLGIDVERSDMSIHLHFMGGSTPKDGPSAGGAIALALASVLTGRVIRRDAAMTGEIDTQGRITLIGSLDVKLETAYDAGCKTVIIPRDNLYGEEGVERLSEALKNELQTLTYEEWKGVREPFDHYRHVLQIVAVDNIVQAADVAFINPDELRAVQDLLEDHARTVAQLVASGKKAGARCVNVLFVKDVRELQLAQFEEHSKTAGGCILLVRPEVREEILRTYPCAAENARVLDFDPTVDDLGVMLKEIERSIPEEAEAPVQLSVLAPYFFLIRQGAGSEGFAPGPAIGELRLFANNYTAQGIKIKGSKAILNQVYHCLALLHSDQLEICPFLSKKDGIYVVDLSFIPEKYRLDTARAGLILNEGLRKWLAAAGCSGAKR